ncbi:mannose-1-phosphate guanylyltransferase [Leptolyngbya sp. NK1-12]|uniref:Mannose-1-phosphate guanylyltransferase n=1 Tax=Leptolyngbya sp. NK1-12 TaxID=2547451 RepID=A0AA96WN46_9CYAN|nr:mannose-1-phosphate guanylyltransferase [Leptolyngbya sp. NK1-12]MBF2049666.1 mannose-1-phosphate guanylyltransferase [Elainella sp. C42_A2020_010]RNJ70199.1 MAG: mannose-1-phosphate guanylyltransferase [Leptolyngbya sp. IPPAS B-1204]WNZ24656.1 mannose-1-phosphate guanylyltransferase [Leptolyngbya sp. NK1-12]
MIPVILAGGKGERFWPLSRKHRPKQFLSLDGSGRSLLQATADRLLNLAGGWSGLWVITAAHLEEGVRQQLPNLPLENLLVEMEGRDTAPAVAWATLEIAQRYGEDAIIGFFPADHWIGEQDVFEQTLKAAEELAQQNAAIATLGIKPTYASTGYGYIEQGEAIGTFNQLPGYKVSRFTEKPDLATAEQFLATGRFSWNGGMFVFPAGIVLKELQIHAPEILQPLQQQGPSAYLNLPKLSIDYALMEKTDRAYVLPVSFSWDDLGDWNAIERLLKDENPNVELAKHVGLDTQGTLLYATDDDDLIVTIGLDDTVIVRDGKVTLIVKKDRTQDIKKILKQLQENPQWANLL